MQLLPTFCVYAVLGIGAQINDDRNVLRDLLRTVPRERGEIKKTKLYRNSEPQHCINTLLWAVAASNLSFFILFKPLSRPRIAIEVYHRDLSLRKLFSFILVFLFLFFRLEELIPETRPLLTITFVHMTAWVFEAASCPATLI